MLQSANLVKLSSQDKSPESRSNSDFVVNYNNAPCMGNINKLIIKQITVPNVFYNINSTGYNSENSGNNVLSIRNETSGVVSDIVVPPGNYTADKLQAYLDTVLPAGLTISLNGTTNKFEFLSTGDPYAYSEDSLGAYLGIVESDFPFGGGGTLLYDLPNFPNLAGVKEVFLSSAKMSDGTHLVLPVGNTLPVFATVPITVGFGEFQSYIAPSAPLDEVIFPSYSAGSNLRTIDVQVRDSYGNILDLGGLDVIIIFKAEHLQN
jgi:hypothetical protein